MATKLTDRDPVEVAVDEIFRESFGHSWRSRFALVQAANDVATALRTAQARGAAGMREAASPASPWRSMDSAPKDTKVLVAYKNTLGNWRRVLACYHTQLPWAEEYYRGDNDDAEYAPEGWYEESETHETIFPVDGTPLAWCEIPTPPAKDEQA